MHLDKCDLFFVYYKKIYRGPPPMDLIPPMWEEVIKMGEIQMDVGRS